MGIQRREHTYPESRIKETFVGGKFALGFGAGVAYWYAGLKEEESWVKKIAQTEAQRQKSPRCFSKGKY